MNGNCRKNINCEESIKKSSYFSANQIEMYENSPELNIRHFVSILFRLLPNKDYRPPSCDVKALMLSFLLCVLTVPECFVLVFSLFISRDQSRSFAGILCIDWDTRTLDNTVTNVAEF